MNQDRWKRVDGQHAPPTDVFVEVCGDSGYRGQRWFVANARCDLTETWLDACGDRLDERGWTPLFWRRASAFPTKEPQV